MKKFNPPWKWSAFEVPNSLGTAMIICFSVLIILALFPFVAALIFAPKLLGLAIVMGIIFCFGYVIYAGFNPEKVKTGKRW